MAAPTFLERYLAGESVAVWDDLMSLGEGVRHELYYQDAVEVANETMRRARHNVELIISRLAEMDYRFVAPGDDYMPDLNATIEQMARQISARPLPAGVEIAPILSDAIERAKQQMAPLAAKISARHEARAAKLAEAARLTPLENRDIFNPPDKQTAGFLRELEKAAGGPLPISFRAWFEQVGGVSLMGSHPMLNPPGDHIPDPLVVTPLRELVNMLDMCEGDEGLALWMAPDDFHKANISGGDAYTITIPNACADATFEYEWHETTFVNYLRQAFAWGGFPGWERSDKAPRKLIAELTAGLLPI